MCICVGHNGNQSGKGVKYPWASEKGAGGPKPPWILKSFAKKGCFLGFQWEKTNFTTFAPPFEKFPSDLPLEKNLPTPMKVSGYDLKYYIAANRSSLK